MRLPVEPGYPPMEALQVPRIPDDGGWRFEPKWDGFRCLAFRDGDQVDLRSKAGRPLGRYFPDIADALAALDAPRFVLDGELLVPIEGTTSFEELQLRLHPAASRVRKLAAAHPAIYVVFDLLVDAEGRPLVGLPLSERRKRLDAFATRFLPAAGSIRLSPETDDPAVARRWLEHLRGGLDGVVAKREGEPYRSGERTGMVKVKRMRTVDCVVGGFRYGEGSTVVGSLLLGLYDERGLLDHVGFTSGLTTGQRRALTPKLEAIVQPPGFTGRAPGGPSRWSERSGEWQPVRPELVVEVLVDHVSDGRFRHGARLLRFRPDKAPEQCTLEQIDAAGGSSLAMLRLAERRADAR